MRLSIAILPLAALSSLASRLHPKLWTDPVSCYQPSCTMSTEKLFHVKLFYNRKEGITPEEFNQYWAYKHGPLAEAFHLRFGVVRYSQFHSTPELRDLAKGQSEILEFDGAAEFWVRELETLAAMSSDPEYIEKIQPDEANFIQASSMRMLIGVDYVVVEDGKVVESHGREF